MENRLVGQIRFVPRRWFRKELVLPLNSRNAVVDTRFLESKRKGRYRAREVQNIECNKNNGDRARDRCEVLAYQLRREVCLQTQEDRNRDQARAPARDEHPGSNGTKDEREIKNEEREKNEIENTHL